ncbi:hypothetical protein DFQ01_13925 [Paenibacillus cellulosilyticus]|uniref:Lipoprotein n=1 Tax=Paenibacillus cellulosilyticus TaxID=375489 RepID=A0A2V2YEQ4_9BACL|nr:hypothetical protein [Paenibacillus cellulosilyticus]PWV90975.1 hypothetical protein DFQ01_13925 [Paenibacillus cellulosilyticus]QKS45193.1 hypothetical protein HUB94_12780 [Paenibacillus cellulosilyticus]
MKHVWKKSALTMTLTITLAGCSLTSGSSPEDEQVVGNDPLAAGQINTNNGGPNMTVNENANWNGGTADNGTLEATGAAKPKPKLPESTLDKAKPTLAGIALGLLTSDVKKKLGEPDDSYAQDGDAGSIDIFEYEGLSIGFGSGNQGVLFIEVYGADVVTGLSGVRVGDSEDAAVKAIGKPDSQSSYLLTYKTTNSLLKLDLDPDSHEILSIKLFTEA